MRSAGALITVAAFALLAAPAAALPLVGTELAPGQGTLETLAAAPPCWLVPGSFG